VKSKDLRVVDGAVLMRLSYRQTKRLWKRYREAGAAGLKHGSAGRRSHRAYPEKFRRRVLERVREKYGGPVGERLGPTLAAEHLASDDGLEVDAETLRRWMLEEGLWSRERRRRRHRRRRERKEHLGELVQMDGSFHPWLEERGPEGCLMELVDDATNTTLARLGEEETIWAAAGGIAGLGGALRSAAGALGGREESISAAGDSAGTVARRRTGDAVRADVREAGDRADRGLLAAGQGASGAVARDASGPAGEEAAAERDLESRRGEPVSGSGISDGTQRAVWASGAEGRELSPAGAGQPGTGQDFPPGE